MRRLCAIGSVFSFLLCRVKASPGGSVHALQQKKNRTQKDPLLLKRESWFSDLICVLFLNKYKTYSLFTLHGDPAHAHSGGEPMLPLPIHSKYMRSVTKKERKVPMSSTTQAPANNVPSTEVCITCARRNCSDPHRARNAQKTNSDCMVA